MNLTTQSEYVADPLAYDIVERMSSENPLCSLDFMAMQAGQIHHQQDLLVPLDICWVIEMRDVHVPGRCTLFEKPSRKVIAHHHPERVHLDKMKQPNPLRGFVQRRECLLPTWRGWLMLLFAGTALIVFSIRGAYSFLAVNDPVYNGALVVEGWLPDYALQQAVTEFRRDHYSRIFVTGGPLEQGAPLSEYRNFAELGAATLVRLGLNTNAVQAVPAPKVAVDRTYASAVALKNWLDQHGAAETNFNVISLGAHSRRSRLLFEKALGSGCRVGVTTVQNEDYDARRWWESSEGVRTVINEMIAYWYARL